MKTLVTTCVNCVIGYKVVVLKTHFSVFKGLAIKTGGLDFSVPYTDI